MTTIESMADRMVELADGLSTLQKLEISNHLLLKVNSDEWDELSFDDKRAVVDLLIDKILVFQDRIEIVWRV
jgi:hypothetical protein